MKSRQFDLVKLTLQMVKVISTRKAVNAILRNIKINLRQLVNMRGYTGSASAEEVRVSK